MAEPIPLPEPLPIPPAQPITVKALVITLWKLNGFVVSVGLCFAAEAVTRAFFGTVSGAIGWIPYLGSVAERPLHDIEHKITSFLGGLEAHIDPSVAWYIQSIADLFARLWDGELESGFVDWTIGRALHTVRATVHALPSLGKLTHDTTVVIKQTKMITKTVYRVAKIAGAAAPGITVGKLAAVAGALEGVIGRDIPNLRDQVKADTDAIARAWKWIREHPLALPGALATAAVAAALARLGASWVKCRNWNRIGKHVCRLPLTLVEDLLGLSLAFLAVVDPVKIAEAAIAAEDAAHSIVVKIAELNPEKG